jgi:hypothetical protein
MKPKSLVSKPLSEDLLGALLRTLTLNPYMELTTIKSRDGNTIPGVIGEPYEINQFLMQYGALYEGGGAISDISWERYDDQYHAIGLTDVHLHDGDELSQMIQDWTEA